MCVFLTENFPACYHSIATVILSAKSSTKQCQDLRDLKSLLSKQTGNHKKFISCKFCRKQLAEEHKKVDLELDLRSVSEDSLWA